MVFRDLRLTCESCGKIFFFTVTEQRRIAEELGVEQVEPPTLCESCRHSAQPTEQPAETQRMERQEAPRATERAAQPAGQPSTAEPPAQPGAQPSAADVFPYEEGGVELKLIGTVKWFSRRKGYGFITKADGEDLFFHRSEVSQRNGGLPEEGQRVEFQIRQTNKGPEAVNVSVLPGE